MDATLYDFGEVISGHSIKHICAALGPIVLIYGGTKRRLRQTVTEGINHAE
jgi:hypothetical protein